MIHEGGTSWACVFGLFIWRIWKNRNLYVFQDKSWSSREIIQGSYSWAFHFFSSSQEVSFGWHDQLNNDYNSEDQVHLFTDGAVQLDSGFATARGVLRDKEGRWIIGFHLFLRKCSVFNVELWGIFEGLQLIQRLGYDHVIIHSYSTEAVKGIRGSYSTISNSALIRRIHNIMVQEKQWFLQYIPREQIQVADCLAKQALFEKGNMQVLDVPLRW
ncbi:hypothetical protein J1N35_038425 [Gossypium stocksii]|uniref:RNase H type-1 domain-containing protein n=1 Tax=Gossypium stocksii TaxID=47602 RepID=A0A9D3ZLV1_9ROSI|nr:hypothetical protein J1N35_038425 [Gossypium stocksii]